ncbi:MAG: ABC transporter ATP-binding protein [Bacteroidetes bacterium]|nr:ABC transporter ATP-binding protein [Bacteroidota bacterium]
MKRPLSYLNKYFFRYKKLLIGGVIFVALSNIFSIYGAVYVRHAFDEVAKVLKSDHIDKNQVQNTLLMYAAIILFAALIRGLFMYLMRQSLIVMSRHIEYDLKNELYSKYQQLDTSFFRTNNTGDLMNRISEDISRVRMYVGPAIMYLVNLVVMFIVVIASMLTVNAELTFWVILPLPILAVSIYFVNNLIEKKSDAMQSQLSNLTSFVQEAFSGLRVIKSFAKEKSIADAFEQETKLYKEKSMSLTLVDALWFPSILLLIGLSSILTVYIGGRQVIEGKITVGNIAEFIIYIGMLSFPVASLGWAVSLIQRAKASQIRINEFLNIQPTIYNKEVTPYTFNQEFSFNHVSFKYQPHLDSVLKDISFKIEKNKSLGIVGSTGSGKSTIAQLILRLYEPTAGEIKIDNTNLNDINLSEYRDQLGYVPQDVFLFSDTIKNNIIFGVDTEDLYDIETAANSAAIRENIAGFNEGYETMVGERGITLSGGQKQRIAIARALIKKPSLLILDDCLSAVDAETEEQILSGFKTQLHQSSSSIFSFLIPLLITSKSLGYSIK